MGRMTYLQFKTFVRFALEALISLKNEPDKAKQEARFDEIINDLKKALED